VIQITRETTFLEGKRKGEKTYQKVFYICSRILDQTKAAQMLRTIRQYWEIEGALHQRLDVTAKEDESRVRNRNALLTLGIVRRCMMSLYCKWRVKMKKKRNTTLNGYYDIMNTYNNQRAFRLIRS